jgi:hypothetical protein
LIYFSFFSILFLAVNLGVHPEFENLFSKYPIQNRKMFERLQGVCSQLAHWAPILAHVREAACMCTCSAVFVSVKKTLFNLV